MAEYDRGTEPCKRKESDLRGPRETKRTFEIKSEVQSRVLDERHFRNIGE